MPAPVFKYSLQPAVDKAVSEEERCRDELAALQAKLREEEAALVRLKEKLAETKQQIRERHDDLKTADSVDEIDRRNAYIAHLGRRSEMEAQAIRQKADDISFLKVSIEAKVRELSEKTAAKKALEKLREKAEAEFNEALRKKDEDQRDDLAIQLWNRRE